MSITVAFEVNEGCITAVVTGVHEPDAAVAEFETLLAQCRIHNADRVLIDYRALEGRGFATQEILYAARASRLYREHLRAGGGPVRLAYLGTSEFIGSWVPGVEVARLEGIDVIATTDEDVARGWLAGRPA